MSSPHALERLPEPIGDAVRELVSSGYDTRKAGLSLWLEPSWAKAQRSGMSADEYGQWVRIGLWNVSGSNKTLTRVEGYRAIAGDQGWIIAAAGYSLEDALMEASLQGAAELLDAAETLIALKGLVVTLPEDELPEKPEAEPDVPKPDFRAPIDFS